MILAGGSAATLISLNDGFGTDPSIPTDFSSFLIRALNNLPTGGNDSEYMFVLAKDDAECFMLPTNFGGSQYRYPATHSGSERCFRQISEWYSNCASNHERCIREDLPLPTRLLDVGGQGTSGDTIWLRDSKDLTEPREVICYLALSYCWGGISHYKTVRDNIDHRKTGFSLGELPAVMRDAIEVTRKCDIKYLWVDALCICQDNEEEWELEAAAMADVYGGAIFTISSLSSPNAETGFLRERRLGAIPIGTITLSYGTWRDPLTVYIRKQPRGLRQEFSHAELSKRAWPLQERILSPAVLHYGRDQLLWECNTDHLTSETGETETESGVVVRLSDKTGAPHKSGPQDLWDCIVDDFTHRQLSVPSDRLRALSGLASKLRKDGTRYGRYVAGLWESDLDFQLLWHSAKESNTDYGEAYKPNTQISSWSWARRNLGVRTMPRARLTSNLSIPPKFEFQEMTEKRLSQLPGRILLSCDIALGGFVQKVGDTAIRVESQPSNHSLTDAIHYPGLPGKGSIWKFDHPIVGQGSHFCLRMMDATIETKHAKADIHYLVLQLVSPDHFSLRADHGYIYRRVGILVLKAVPKEFSTKPYRDILFDNGKPLLTDGEWQDLILE
ncbi:MAG: hypothetical protein Q9219_003611 [cf. Caloplaca sp. 3 TL-2023]